VKRHFDDDGKDEAMGFEDADGCLGSSALCENLETFTCFLRWRNRIWTISVCIV